MDDLFWANANLKTKRFWICQTGGMSLWIALQVAANHGFLAMGNNRLTKEEYRSAVLSFPGKMSTCRCKDCRYFRIARGKK